MVARRLVVDARGKGPACRDSFTVRVPMRGFTTGRHPLYGSPFKKGGRWAALRRPVGGTGAENLRNLEISKMCTGLSMRTPRAGFVLMEGPEQILRVISPCTAGALIQVPITSRVQGR